MIKKIHGKRLLIVLLLSAAIAKGQKLPNVQQVSMWAPANIKVDGTADEWGNKYQAYNNATEVYYTISNDSENIYLVIEIKKAIIIDKILKGNISLTVNHTLNKKDGAPVTIAYPALKRADAIAISNVLNSRFGVNDIAAAGTDNSIEGLNNLLSTRSKSIKIQGVKNLPVDDISVYNEEGIKAVSKFAKSLVYVYELAIPLKYLDLPNNGLDGFSYHIKMNVEDESVHQFAPPMVTGGNIVYPPPPPPASASIATTDFWGTYTFAKKP